MEAKKTELYRSAAVIPAPSGERKPTEFNRSAVSTRPILDAKWNGRSTFSIEEAGEILGVSRWSAYEAAKNGQLPVVWIGRRGVVPRHALEQMLDVAPVTAA
jgi:excisionase family DNA binding protein